MVKRTILFAGLVIGFLNQGCTSCLCHPSKCGPLDYHLPLLECTPLSECCLERRNWDRAEKVWLEVQRASSGRRFSHHYECGFKHGFADYLNRGGSANLPEIPPRHYWKPKYETPQGRRELQDWFAGFQNGVATARATGWHEAGYVPTTTSLPLRSTGYGSQRDGDASHYEILPETPPGIPLQMPSDDLLDE